MANTGKIASRIFSKHLKIEDEFDDEQDSSLSTQTEGEESEQTASFPNKLAAQNKELAEEPYQSLDDKEDKNSSSKDINNPQDNIKKNLSKANITEENNSMSEMDVHGKKLITEDDNEEGELLVLNFDNSLQSSEVNENAQDSQKEDGNDENNEEELMLDNIFLDYHNPEESGEDIDIGFQIDQDIENDLEIPKINLEYVDKVETNSDNTDIVSNSGSDTFKLIESEEEEVSKDDSIAEVDIDIGIEDVEQSGTEIEFNLKDTEQIENSDIKFKNAAKDEDITSEDNEEDILTELAVNYDELHSIDDSFREFLLKNIGLLTRERICICLENGNISIQDYKSFFEDALEGESKDRVYNEIRIIEMQYLFENFIQCFETESFTRRKTSIDGQVVKNIVELKDNILIDIYDSLNSTNKAEIQKGECSFILGHKVQLNVEEHIEDIINSKLNCDNVFLVVLDGTIVDEQAINLANRYKVRIIKMDMPISIINKNLELIKKRIIL